MIYLDNASTKKIKDEDCDYVAHLLKELWGNPSNLYKIGEYAKHEIEMTRKKIARVLLCEPEEIFFTSGASEGNSWALHQRKRCVCSAFEHHNILNHPDSFIVGETYLVDALKQKEKGGVFFGNWSDFVYSHMYVNNETGEIFDINKFYDIAHALHEDTIFHCDMTQALGNTNVNFTFMDVDVATFSGHKIGTPKGIGFNYFNRDYFDNSTYLKTIKPLIYGGGQENGLRHGTENVPYIALLGIKVEQAVKNFERRNIVAKRLKELLIREVTQKGFDFYVVSPVNSIHSTFAFCLKNVESEAIAQMLSEKEIYIGTGSACNTGELENDKVLEAMKVPEDYIRGLIRVSTSDTTTEQDIVNFVEALYNICKEIGVGLLEEDNG